MKNKRILSIGKFSFSPSFEQTPKARSAKNNFIFSIMGGDFNGSKFNKNRLKCISTLRIRMFKWAFFFFLISAGVFGQENPVKSPLRFISDVQLSPAKLKLEIDSIRFSIQGTIPNESLLMPRNPRLSLKLYSEGDTINLGDLPLVKGVANFSFEKSFSLYFRPWMESAILELYFYQGSKTQTIPFETSILAKGVSAPQLLLSIGEPVDNEPVPQIGILQPSGKLASNSEKTEDFFPRFIPGTSELEKGIENSKVFSSISDFLEKNPDVVKVKITGLQSPEQAEGRSSLLGWRRAKAAGDALRSRFSVLDSSKITLDSRWNDWFDLRLLLESFEGATSEDKENIQLALIGQGSYLEKWEQVKKMKGFDRISKELFPKLRTARIEITSKPLLGLSFEQFNLLRKNLSGEEQRNQLSFEDWAVAAEVSPSLEDKAQIYSKMTQYFRSPSPYVNMAVIRMRQAQSAWDLGSKEVLWDEADRLLEEGLRIDPNNAYALHNQGQILALRGSLWEAYKKLSEASVLSEDAEFLDKNDLLRGTLDILRGDYKLAILRFQHQLSDPIALFNKGLAYYLIGDYVNAALAFEESVNWGREIGYGYYGLALLAAQSGQDETAFIHLQKAISFNKRLAEKMIFEPNFQVLRNNPAFLKNFKINW